MAIYIVQCPSLSLQDLIPPVLLPLLLTVLPPGRRALLKALETGSNLYFRFICGDPETLTYTAQDGLYYGAFAQWKEEVAALYAAYAAVADKTAGARIDSHRRIGADAYETRYTNGVRVLVNYADEPMDFEGIAISAQGYAVI